MSRFKTAKSRRAKVRNAKRKMRRSKRKSQRPICPQCGSADVVAGQKTGKCNHCGEMFEAIEATNYFAGTGEARRIEPVFICDDAE